MAFLHTILRDTEREISASKQLRSIGDLKRMIRDAPEPRSFRDALSSGHGIIAEIKLRSPSAGEMRKENVEQAPAAYDRSPIVKAISVLTNSKHFGMAIDDLKSVRSKVRKPLLRKDFISKEYQVYEARAFGADAILLMANVLSPSKMRALFELANELRLDVLFEAHCKREIDEIPQAAKIYGINSRKFMASKRWFVAKMVNRIGLWRSGKGPDPSVELQAFNLVNDLPKDAIKVAESGVKPNRIKSVIDLGYDAVLVGTSLLKAPEGIYQALSDFEQAVIPQAAFRTSPVAVPA